jgi:hypothetical protein
MRVTTCQFSTRENSCVLIDACVKECRKWSGILTMIEIWDPSPFLRDIDGVKVEERGEGISSLAIFNDEEVEWVGNEFLHWF